MTLKELILNDMPSNLDEIERARYIYLKLAMYLNFSTKLQNTSESEFANMYNADINLDNIKNNQIVCKYWSKIYSQLLDEVGVSNEIINVGHEFVRFIGNGKLWVADATYGSYTDLSRIRYGDDTKYFGVAFFQNLEKKENIINILDPEMKRMSEIDKKFHFYDNQRQLLDEIHKKMIQEKQIPDLSKKLENLFEIIGALSSGYYESKDYVRNLISQYLTKEELEHVHAVELKRTNQNKEVDIVQCIYVDKGNGKYDYYLLAPNLPIKKEESTIITKLSLLGYGIEDKNIPGVIYPRKFVCGKVDSRILITKLFVPTTLKEYDKEQIDKII